MSASQIPQYLKRSFHISLRLRRLPVSSPLSSPALLLVNYPVWRLISAIPFLPHYNTALTHFLKYDLNHETTAGADGGVFAVAQVPEGDLEPVATWAWVVVELEGGVECHVFDFYFVVVGHFGEERVLGGGEA